MEGQKVTPIVGSEAIASGVDMQVGGQAHLQEDNEELPVAKDASSAY